MSNDAPPPYPTKGDPAGQPPQPANYNYAPAPPPAGYPAQPAGYPAQPAGYPPQQYGQPAQYGGTTNTVVVTGGPAVVVQQFRESPVQCVCPSCSASVVTATHYETGTLTWLIAGVCLLMGLWLGCCLIPFCVDGCKDVVHSCPNCKNVIRRWNRM